MPADYARALEICNLVLTIAFIVELLKLGGLGFNSMPDRFNLFDAAVVLISIIELRPRVPGRYPRSARSASCAS